MCISKPRSLLVLTLFMTSFNLTLQQNKLSLNSFPLTLARLSAFKAKVDRKNNASQSSSSPPFNYPRLPFKYYSMALIASFPIGTPSQHIQMVLDTGSQLTWMACDTTMGTSFHHSHSSTFSYLLCNNKRYTCPISDATLGPICHPDSHRCGYSYFYADGTLAEGNFVKENFSFTTLILGCTSKKDSSGADGILGMNLGPLSFTSQLKVQTFSYCVPRRGNNPTGILYLGPNPNSPTFQYVGLYITPPGYSRPNFDPHAYSVPWLSILIHGKRFVIPEVEPNGSGQTIIDSGSQYTYLVRTVYSEVKAQVLKLAGSKLKKGYVHQGLDLCFNGNSGEIGNMIGDIVFEFGNKQRRISVLISKTNILDDVGRGVTCFAVASSESLGDVDMNIIGNFHQQNRWVEFDVKNKRVGVGNTSDCNK